MKRYRYKHKRILPLIKVVMGSALIIGLSLFLFPSIYHAQTGKELFPPEPEDIEETYQIIEPAVMSTKMIEAERESREQAESKAEVLTETQYIAMTMEVAAYSPLDNKSGMCADDDPTVTAAGTKPGMGTIAVDPSIIPFGTKMYVPSYGWGIALDTGQIIREKGNLIEVFMPTYEEAREWGRKKNVVVFVEVEI